MNGMPQERINSTDEAKPNVRRETGAQSVSDSTPLLWLTVLSLDAPAVAVTGPDLVIIRFDSAKCHSSAPKSGSTSRVTVLERIA